MKPEERLVELLKLQGKTITTAESCTGGLIAKRITDVSGSSAVFECALVSYSNRIKHEKLGVKKETLEKYGAVSEQTACEMAQGALEFAGADIAVAVTGIAGPDSDGTDKPVGLVYIAATDGKKMIVKKHLNKFETDIRRSNREKSAEEAFNLVLENFL